MFVLRMLEASFSSGESRILCVMNMQTGNHQLKGSCVPSEGKFYCRKIFKKIGATPKEILPVTKVYREAFRLACQENGTVSPTSGALVG
jgi:hypothetical protein